MVPHSWIGECLEMFGIAVNVRQFLLSSMKKWKTELTSCGQELEVVNSCEERDISGRQPLTIAFCIVHGSTLACDEKIKSWL